MMKRRLAFGLCFAVLLISLGLRGQASKSFYRQAGDDAQEDSGDSTLPLPEAKDSWLIEMSRGGGMRPGKESVSVNSDGEIQLTSAHFPQGKLVVECSLKEKLSPGDLQELKLAVRAARPANWHTGYEDPKHPVCCDQPTSHLTLSRRASNDGKREYNTSWYPGSSQLRPADLVKVAELTQALWNKSREHCGG
ncbi:MAG TPA: hypothetical protein VJT09_17410 [Pyrinomonadaceae bacterium]|nr:hypothetical protein [Pyrinomonadaceae bacterium]